MSQVSNLGKYEIHDTKLKQALQSAGASGLRWHKTKKKPPQGIELTNSALAEALKSKTDFTQRDWDAFGIAKFSMDFFIKSGSCYFIPVAALSERQWASLGVRGLSSQSYIRIEDEACKRWTYMKPTVPEWLSDFSGNNAGGRGCACQIQWLDACASSYSGEISEMFDASSGVPVLLRMAFSNASAVHDEHEPQWITEEKCLDAADLGWLSVWPKRNEWLFPPRTRIEPAHNWGLMLMYDAAESERGGSERQGSASTQRAAFFIDCKATITNRR